MKVLKTALFLAILSIGSIQVNATNELVDPIDELRTQLFDLINHPAFWGNVEYESSLMIRLQINDQGEILVFSTNNPKYDSTVKAMLNYKKIKVHNALKNKPIVFPVKLKRSPY
ncbi:MAG: hypothetical protein HKN16_06690 [Saprospiraceae bacterium]|nr:hypothetical protein [Saprospiraceae bacterium]